MRLEGISAAVTGGASGLGLATARRIVKESGTVTIIDLPTSAGADVAKELGEAAQFVAADVTDADQFAAALDAADERGGLRGLVHCAGAGRKMRVLDRDGNPGSLEDFEWVIKLNLVGSFNALRLGAARMARHDAIDGERGAVVLTASVATYEGQIGQISYTAAKAGIVGMTLTAARDLAGKSIRVCAPDRAVRAFDYRLVRPAFVPSRIVSAGQPGGSAVDLAIGAEGAGPSLTAKAGLG